MIRSARLAGALALATTCVLCLPALARAGCGWSGYSYAGFESPRAASGVSTTLALLGQPLVQGGHVAAWVGLGGSGLGPHGTDEWIQVGIARKLNGGSELYYEVQRPGDERPLYRGLGAVAVGEAHRLAVVERANHRNQWSVWVDDKRRSPVFTLPASHDAWQPVATAESWDGGASVCNRYSFSFRNLAIATRSGGGDWAPFSLAHVLRDPAYRLTLAHQGFDASSRL
jgi:hypothetical protein